MSGTVHHKLFSLEIPPPAENWEKIARRLDEDYHASEIATGQRLYDLSIPAPESAWPAIAAGLSVPPAPVHSINRNRVRILQRIAVAAAVLVLVLFAGYYWILHPDSPGPGGVSDQSSILSPSANGSADQNGSDDSDSRLTAAVVKVPRSSLRHPTVKVPGIGLTGSTILNEADKERYDAANVAAAPVTMLQPYETSGSRYRTGELPGGNTEPENPNISANVSVPLIRDPQGRLIMDRHTLVSTDQNYITVTGPNGQQTRISSKFLPVISYMNDPSQDAYLDIILRGGQVWKHKFEEWRNRILEKTEYTPAGSNFLDIFELQDLLRENE